MITRRQFIGLGAAGITLALTPSAVLAAFKPPVRYYTATDILKARAEMNKRTTVRIMKMLSEPNELLKDLPRREG